MKLLTREREQRGWSKSELARRAGLHPSSVGQIESGRLAAYPGQLTKLAAALGFAGDPARLVDEVQHAESIATAS